MTAMVYTPLAECGSLTDERAQAYDRRWLVVHEDGRWMTRADFPQLAEVTVELRLGYLVVRAPGMLRLDIPLDVIEDDDSVRFTAMVGDQEIDVVDEGELATAWMSSYLRQPCGIMKVHPDVAEVRWPRG